ncbi:MAG: pilus assembly protein [Acetobacter sp.]|nr:pilus assembly protein [Acetobacter sp.]
MFSLHLFSRFSRHLDKIRNIQAQRGAQKFVKDKKGVSAIEFALVFPLFIVVIVAIINVFWCVISVMGVQNTMYSTSRFVENGSSPNHNLAWTCMTSGQRANAATNFTGQPVPATILHNINAQAQVGAANGWGGSPNMGFSFLSFQYSGRPLIPLNFKWLGGALLSLAPQVNNMYSFSFTRSPNVPCNQ